MTRTDLQLDVNECEDVNASHNLASPVTMRKLEELQPGCRSVYNAEHTTLVDLLSWLAEVRRTGFTRWVEFGLTRCTAEAIILRNSKDFSDDRIRSKAERRLRKYAPDYVWPAGRH